MTKAHDKAIRLKMKKRKDYKKMGERYYKKTIKLFKETKKKKKKKKSKKHPFSADCEEFVYLFPTPQKSLSKIQEGISFLLAGK